MADFESGIARALREVGKDREPEPSHVQEASRAQASQGHQSGGEDDTLEGPTFSAPAAVGAGYEQLFPGGRGYHKPRRARVRDARS